MGSCRPGLLGHLRGLEPAGLPPDRRRLCSRGGDAENQHLAVPGEVAPCPPGNGLPARRGGRFQF
eukprot:9714534-Alexandrium_andersonii.AAC.1